MPLRYKIIEHKKLVYVIGDGEITLDELIAHIEELSKDPEYTPPMKKLVDYRQASTMGPPNKDLDIFINKMSSYQNAFRNEKCAIVVNNDLDFGISRVYGAMIEPANLETNVFRNFNEALQWLEIELDDNETLF